MSALRLAGRAFEFDPVPSIPSSHAWRSLTRCSAIGHEDAGSASGRLEHRYSHYAPFGRAANATGFAAAWRIGVSGANSDSRGLLDHSVRDDRKATIRACSEC